MVTRLSHNKHVFAAAVLFVVSLIIVSIWFRDGKLIASGEEGPLFYDVARVAQVYSSAWVRWGTGFVYSVGLPLSVSMSIISVLTGFVANVQIQFVTFTLLIFSGMFGAYAFAHTLTRNRYISLIAGSFYFFNLFALSQVWRRSLLVGMYSWAYLPIFSYLFARWLDEGKVRILMCFIVFNFVFAMIFANPGYVFAFLITSALLLLFRLFSTNSLVSKTRLIARLGAFAFVFLAINVWWIYPYAKLSGSTYSDVASNYSIDSLRGVSRFFPISRILQLRQDYYFNSTVNPDINLGSIGTWYEGWQSYLISLLIVGVVVYGIGRWHKRQHWPYLIASFVISLFLIKGSNPPLGESFFEWLFTTFPIASAIRNPYEKLGSLFILFYSLFFGIGLFELSNRIGKFKLIVTPVVLVLVYGVVCWPLWTGRVFENYEFVTVPPYYAELNNFIKTKTGESRLLFLPAIPDYYAAYTWGYTGSETSEYLFDSISLSKRLDLKSYTQIYNDMKNTIESGADPNIIFQHLNIGYIIVRRDMDWMRVGSISPDTTKTLLTNSSSVRFVKAVGDLDLYEYVNRSNSFITLEGVSIPTVSYERQGNRKYIITIRNATQPFKLILKEGFDTHWIARVGKDQLDGHELVYNYANGWTVTKTGDFTIDVVFRIWPWD